VDLQDFNSDMLYFQEEIPPEVEALVEKAANEYGAESEGLLLRALSMGEENLVVLVGLYRFYYYQHRYENALEVAHRVLSAVGKRIAFPEDWRDITMAKVSNGVVHSFCLVRLYFFALKAAGYVNLRLCNFEVGRAMIEKVVAMDSVDRMGARLLLEVLDGNKADIIPFANQKTAEAYR